MGAGVGTSRGVLADLVFRLVGSPANPLRSTTADRGTAPRRLIACTDAASADLGFTARRSIEDGIAEEIGWFRSLLTAPATEFPVLAPSSRPVAPAMALEATA